MTMEKLKQKRWARIALYVIGLIGIGLGFLILFPYLVRYFNIPLQGLASTAYLVVFGITLLCNAAVLIPVTYPHLTVMIAAAAYWDPFMVALVASVGGALGEITAYYAGYLGKRVARLENAPGYNRLVGWMERHGFWGILVVSFQPILPVDIAGLLAGASKLPLWKFLVPCWIGKLGKYLLACYLGAAVLRLLPPLPFFPQ
ncbi:MAG: VTT domain-containing protein [Dehalococcoidia bacterium]|nr:VTT domain-containing protein [Dehalococcoidia bacterium]